MSERKKIKERLNEIQLSDFDTGIDKIIVLLNELKSRYSDYHDLFLETDVDYGYYEEDARTYFTLYGYRFETDKEVEKRTKRTDKKKVKQL